MDVSAAAQLIVQVVDDDPSVAKALSRLLRASGHVVHVAHDVRAGLDLASRTRPDLILHDIVMPGLDGYEGARRLRGISLLSATILIACSGSVDETLARQAGFDGWLLKPITSGELDIVLASARERLAHGGAGRHEDFLRDLPERSDEPTAGGQRFSASQREP
jgi:DNA-binding response OmpR family regulator